MRKQKTQSIASKILRFSIGNTIFIGIALICSGYFLQSSILTGAFTKQASEITQEWASQLNSSDVEAAKKATDYDDPAQKNLRNTSIFYQSSIQI